MFIRRLDDIQTAKENMANRPGKPVDNPIYATDDEQKLRWSRFTNERPDNMLVIVRDGVFPWLRSLGGDDSTYAQHMKDARFTIPTPNLLTKVVDLLDDIPLGEQGHARATCTSTCSARSPRLGRTASSGPRGTSSSSWSR